MQIREQGRKVQLIRSPYSKELKKCVSHVAHTFERHKARSGSMDQCLSVEQIADLSDAEKIQLSDWLKRKMDESLSFNRSSSIRSSAYTLSELADAISSDGVDEKTANVIYQKIDNLLKALKKSGHKKPKAVTKKQLVVSPGQSGLDLNEA